MSLGNGVWVIALAAMALCSARAWRRIDANAWAPLQWAPDGFPLLRCRREFVVTFTPVLSMTAGLQLADGVRDGQIYGPGWAALRLIAPVLLAIAHHLHLTAVVATLKAEGGLKA